MESSDSEDALEFDDDDDVEETIVVEAGVPGPTDKTAFCMRFKFLL